MHDRRWEEAYQIAMNRSNAFFNYREIYKDLLAMHEPLPKLEDVDEEGLAKEWYEDDV